ncbi:unnamed protein product [Schistosoma bovis]|nr:unnamed protein product [Schistosoma bovis]
MIMIRMVYVEISIVGFMSRYKLDHYSKPGRIGRPFYLSTGLLNSAQPFMGRLVLDINTIGCRLIGLEVKHLRARTKILGPIDRRNLDSHLSCGGCDACMD